MSGADTSEGAAELLARYSTNSLREARELLRRAHVLLLTRYDWTKGAWARDSAGRKVAADDDAAVSWCAGGAVLRTEAELHDSVVEIPVDPESDEATEVLGPKRVVVALELLGLFLLAVNRNRVSLEEVAPARKPKPLREQHPTLLASDINDLRQIAHPHVLLGLIAALVAIHDELAERGKRLKRDKR